MGREIRRVPVNWNHPKNANGRFKPLRGAYLQSLDDYKKDVLEFCEHMHALIHQKKVKIYSEIFTNIYDLFEFYTKDGQLEAPNVSDYHPSGEWYQLYENVSAGTPLSPPFKTKKELITWLSTNKDFWGNTWTKEGAERIVHDGYAPSLVMQSGTVYKPEEQYKLAN